MTTSTKRAAALAVLLLAGRTAAAEAQVGAIGAAPGFYASSGESTAGAPILVENAFRFARGQFGASALLGVTSGSMELGSGLGDLDYTYSQFLVAAFWAPSDRLTLGLSAAPYLAIDMEAAGMSEDDSGTGDVGLYAKAALWGPAGGKTSMATWGSLVLPAGESGWGHEGVVAGAGLVVSHRLDRVTLHGAGGFLVPTDDADGKTTLNLSGAAVYSATPSVALSVELMAASSDGESIVDVAPGARFRIGRAFFLNAAILANAATSFDVKPYDYALVLGANYVR